MTVERETSDGWSASVSKMTGISDLVRPSCPNVLITSLVEQNDSKIRNKPPLFDVRTCYDRDEAEPRSKIPAEILETSIESPPFYWGLLLPICSRGSNNSDECFSKLETFLASLLNTTSAIDRQKITLYIGMDAMDPIYDSPDGKLRLRELFEGKVVAIKISSFSIGYREKICWIWDELAQEAVKDGK